VYPLHAIDISFLLYITNEYTGIVVYVCLYFLIFIKFELKSIINI